MVNLGKLKICYNNEFRSSCINKMSSPLLGEAQFAMKFSDNKVCKSFLVGCCPHDILATTVSSQTQSFHDLHRTLLEVYRRRMNKIHKVFISVFVFDSNHTPLSRSRSLSPLFYFNLINFHHHKNEKQFSPSSLVTLHSNSAPARLKVVWSC